MSDDADLSDELVATIERDMEQTRPCSICRAPTHGRRISGPFGRHVLIHGLCEAHRDPIFRDLVRRTIGSATEGLLVPYAP